MLLNWSSLGQKLGKNSNFDNISMGSKGLLKINWQLLKIAGKSFISDVPGFHDQLQRLMLKCFYCIAATMKFPEFRKMKTKLLSMKFTHNKHRCIKLVWIFIWPFALISHKVIMLEVGLLILFQICEKVFLLV